MAPISRPLDLLNVSKGKTVMLNLVDGKQYVGKLVAFDIHINIVLDNTKELVNGEQATSFGQVFFRGDSVVFISPSN